MAERWVRPRRARLFKRTPRVSIFLCTFNGMPYLEDAVESVKAQTFRDFELVIDDGASTDGTIEYLTSIEGIPCVDFKSAPHTGIGQARNRAISRCRGAIIGSIDQDNLLEPDAIEAAVAWIDEHPDVAAIYGGSNIVAPDGTLLRPWMPAEFDLLHLLYCELVPPLASAFFVRANCGDELWTDEAMLRCEDFDLWLRLSKLPIRRVERSFGSTRFSDMSLGRNTDTFDGNIRWKSDAIERYFAHAPSLPVIDAVKRRALAGIRLWAAECIYELDGGRTQQYERYLADAAALDPTYERLTRARERLEVDSNASAADASAGRATSAV